MWKVIAFTVHCLFSWLHGDHQGPLTRGFLYLVEISYAYFPVKTEWQMISPAPQEPSSYKLRYYSDVKAQRPVFQALDSLSSLKTLGAVSQLEVPPRGVELRTLNKFFYLYRVWTHEFWGSMRACYTEIPKLTFQYIDSLIMSKLCPWGN